MASDKLTVGNCEIIALHDLDLDFPAGMMFPNVPMAEFDVYRDLYPDCFGKIGFAADCGAYAVRSAGKTIVVDTGIGPGPIQMLGGIEGKLLADMKNKGVSPESVDMVVMTHLHVDHVGWNVGPDGKPNFPNARYYGPSADWEFFSQNLAANPHMEQVVPLNEQDRLELYEGETSLTAEVTTMPTPGHTPGHHSVLVTSGGEKILITGDLAHHPAQIDRCEWCPSFDMDHETATATRTKVLDRLEAEGTLAAFCHFPGNGFGRIVRDGNRRVFQAL
jgi:glyoxylase-like metal-dependent hydrolase (beta-lactamase superfamily II)